MIGILNASLRFLAVAVVAMSCPLHPASASSCVNPKTVQITFEKASRCWTYNGDATHFSGRFAAGEKVIATSTGMAIFSDGIEWRTTRQRDVDVRGPSGFWVDGTADQPLRLPRSGIYTFGFSPCAMWRLPGTFVVCVM